MHRQPPLNRLGTVTYYSTTRVLIADGSGYVDQGMHVALVPLHELVALSQPFWNLLLKWVHLNLIRLISIIRLLRKSTTLIFLLISFTRSVSHLSLAILVSDCQFCRLLHLRVPTKVVTKTLASVTIRLLIILPLRRTFLAACGNCLCHPFQVFKKSASLPKPKTWSAQRTFQANPWLMKYFELTRLCLLANVSRFASRLLVADSGSSCITISFNICSTITCTVAPGQQLLSLHDFFPNMSTFLCQIHYLVTDADHRVLVLYSSAYAAHPACNLTIGTMPIRAQFLYRFTELSDYHKCCKTPDSSTVEILDADLGQQNCYASRNELIVTSWFAAGRVL